MSLKKIIKFQVINRNGKLLPYEYKFSLKILHILGNYLIHKNVLRLHSLKSQGTSSTKTRKEVQGGGRKPWRQKGTGNARAGSTRSPLWKGGGVIFGPKSRKKVYKINKKERQLAIQTLLYNKRKDCKIIYSSELNYFINKTKDFCELCQNCNFDLNQKILIITTKKMNSLKLAINNLENVELITVSNLNILNLIKSKHILLTPMSLDEIKNLSYE